MNKSIINLCKKLTDINAKLCCLCYSHVKEDAACVQDFIVLSWKCDDVAKEFPYKEEIEIHYVLQQILDSKVADHLSESDPICNECMQSAINSYKFIKMCREKSESMAVAVEAFTSNLELTVGMDMQNYKTMFIVMESEESQYTQYYDTAQFADSNAALYKFQTVFRPYRTVVDKKGNTKYKCTKCQGVFHSQSGAMKHFNVKHTDDRDIIIDEIENSLSDDNDVIDDINDSTGAPNWTKRYNRDNIRHLNELSHEVIIDCNGVNKYKCKVCQLLCSSAANARKHYRIKHLPGTKKNTNIKCKRARNYKLETVKTAKMKPDYLYQFNYCRDNIKHLNRLSHTVIKDSYGATKFKCKGCPKILSNAHAARGHYLKYHTKEEDSDSRKDSDSKKYSDSKTQTKNEEINHQNNYTCILCNEKFDNKYILIAHLLQYHAMLTCNETTLKDINLLGNDIYKHIYTEVECGDKKFCCKICLKLFKYYGNIRSHFNIDHVNPIEKFVCSHCGKEGFKTKHHLRRHEQRHEELKVICDTCNQVFKNKYYLKDHKCIRLKKMMRGDAQREFICKKCGKKYTKMYSLQSHMRSTHGPKKHQCPHCPKVFSDGSRLKGHLITHTKVKNFSCDKCGDVFVAKNSLVYHTRIHTGELPYECSYCKRRFLSASRRADHVRRHHIAAMAMCSICGITIKQAGMSKHMSRHAARSREALRTSRMRKKTTSDCESVGDTGSV